MSVVDKDRSDSLVNIKHVCHLHQQNALFGQIHIHEAVRAVVLHITQLCLGHCPRVSWVSLSVQQMGAKELSDQQKLS